MPNGVRTDRGGSLKTLFPFSPIDTFSVATNQNKVCRVRLVTFGISSKLLVLLLDGKLWSIPFPPPLGTLRSLSVNSSVLLGSCVGHRIYDQLVRVR